MADELLKLQNKSLALQRFVFQEIVLKYSKYCYENILINLYLFEKKALKRELAILKRIKIVTQWYVSKKRYQLTKRALKLLLQEAHCKRNF